MKKPAAELLAKWNRKLAKSGFVDIEEPVKGEPRLKNFHTSVFSNMLASKIQHNIAYFEYAQKFLWIHEFKKPIHRTIWELHCEGLAIRPIARRIKWKQTKTFEVVKMLRQEMKIALQIR